MDTLRSVGRLQCNLGDELFAAIVSSDNAAAVKAFAEELVKTGIPTTMTLGDRSYGIRSFLEEEGSVVPGSIMARRVAEMSARSGQEDGQYLLEHQAEIPVALRGKVAFVFQDWWLLNYPESITVVDWVNDRWAQCWSSLHNDWGGRNRVLCRKFGI